MKEDYFIIGNPKVPEWIQKELRSGKINQVYDEENEEMITKISSATKTYTLHDGDVIMKTKHGLIGIDEDTFNRLNSRTNKPITIKKYEEENENE